MNRRNAIKSMLSGLILPVALPGMAQTKEFPHLIGLGGAGCNALQHIHSKGCKARYTFITEADHDFPAGTNFIKYPSLYKGNPSPVSPARLTDDIRNLFNKQDKYVLLCGLGRTGGLLMNKIMETYSDTRDIQVITTLPYRFEGAISRKRAEKQLRTGVNYRIIPLESLRNMHGNITVGEAFSLADEALCQQTPSLSL